jgi:hypothetical protein
VSLFTWALKSKRNFWIVDTAIFSLVMIFTFIGDFLPIAPLTSAKVERLFLFFLLAVLGGLLVAWMHWVVWGKNHQL